MEQDKFLGYIILKDGIKIDPNRVASIQKLTFLGIRRRFGHF